MIEAGTATISEPYEYSPLSYYALFGSGVWSVTGGSLVQTEDATASAIDGRIAGSNSEVSSTVYSTDTTGEVALFGRFRDLFNNYRFLIDKTNGRAKLIRLVQGVTTVLADVPYVVDLNNGGNGRLLKLSMLGKRLRGFVGTTQVVTADDNTAQTGWLTAGRFGFYSKNMGSPDVRFRDLTVTPQTGAEP